VSALACFRRHPGLSLRQLVRRLVKTVRRHLSTVLPPTVLMFAAAVALTAWVGWHAADLLGGRHPDGRRPRFSPTYA